MTVFQPAFCASGCSHTAREIQGYTRGRVDSSGGARYSQGSYGRNSVSASTGHHAPSTVAGDRLARTHVSMAKKPAPRSATGHATYPHSQVERELAPFPLDTPFGDTTVRSSAMSLVERTLATITPTESRSRFALGLRVSAIVTRAGTRLEHAPTRFTFGNGVRQTTAPQANGNRIRRRRIPRISLCISLCRSVSALGELVVPRAPVY